MASGYLLNGITVPGGSINDAVSDDGNGIVQIAIENDLDNVVEKGRLFYSSPVFTVPATPSKYYVKLVTGPKRLTHMYITFLMDAPGLVNSYINPGSTSGGTAAFSGNFYIGSNNTSGLVATVGVTPTTLGTKISDFIVLGSATGNGGNSSSTGSLGSFASKIIVPANTQFLVEYASDAAVTARASLILNWYEQD